MKTFNGSKNIFFNIVAKMELTLSKDVEKDARFVTSIADEHEHYRFIYNRQQMPIEDYRPKGLENYSYTFLALSVFCLLLIMICATYLFTRKIAPMIARIRNNNNMVEEDKEEGSAPKDDLEIVPPSSDRNQRVADLAV